MNRKKGKGLREARRLAAERKRNGGSPPRPEASRRARRRS